MSQLGASSSRTFQQDELSPRALDLIRNLDSRCFGFLGLQDSPSQQFSSKNGERSHEKNCVSKELIHMGIRKLMQDKTLGPQSITHQSEVLCQLGHLHLLLEDYTKAMSAYQQYQSINPSESSTNVNFLYGMGLIYFHMNSFKWGIDVFQKVLRLSPNFARSSEVHLRLGVMFRKKREYSKSVEHFRKALSIPGPSSLSKLEIQYHIGHLHYLQGNNIAAKQTFEGILSSKSVHSTVKAMALRQLGWLYHAVPEISNSVRDPHIKATELLNLSVGADSSSSQAWYFLGRCHAHHGRIQEAFMAYQHAISRASGGQADIWCSIGLLYQKVSQPKDSLQSYLCAVYLDPQSLASWVNMGCLYESAAQPMDAVLCYKNAATIVQGRTTVKYPAKYADYVFSRVSNLENYIGMLGPTAYSQPRSIPSLHEAWHTLIPSNVREKRSPPPTPRLQLFPPSPAAIPISPFQQMPSFVSPVPFTPGSTNMPGGRPLCPPPIKRARTCKSKDPIIIKNINEGWSKHSSPTCCTSSSITPAPMATPSLFNFTPTHPNPLALKGNGFNSGTGSLESGMRNRNVGMGYSDMGLGGGGMGMNHNPFFEASQLPGSYGPFQTSNLVSPGSANSTNHLKMYNSNFDNNIGNVPGNVFHSNFNFGTPSSISLPPHSSFLGEPSSCPSSASLPLDGASAPLSHHTVPTLLTQQTPRPTHLRLSPFQPVDHSQQQRNKKTGPSPRLASNPPPLTPPSCSQVPHPVLNTSDYPYTNPNANTIGSNLLSSCSPVADSDKTESVQNTSYASPANPGSVCPRVSPSELPPSASTSPFPPFSANSVNSTFSSSLSPESYSNNALPISLSDNPMFTPNSVDIPDDLTSVYPLKMNSEVKEYLDQYLTNEENLASSASGSCHGSDLTEVGLMSNDGMDSGIFLNGGKEKEGTQVMSPDGLTGKVDGEAQVTPLPPLTINSVDLRLNSETAGSTWLFNVSDSITSPTMKLSSSDQQIITGSSNPATPPISASEDSLPSAELLIGLEGDEPPLSEEASDSGVSSAGTKPSTSCSSEDNSPIGAHSVSLPIITSPMNSLSTPSTGSSEGHFSYPESPQVFSFPPDMNPDKLLDPVKEPYPSLAAEAEYMILSPDLTPPPAPLPKKDMDLMPKIEIFQVKDRDTAFSEELHAFCCDPDRPICIIRGLCSVLDLNIGLFSSESLAQTCPDHEIEVRDQIQQAADENFDPSGRRQVWKCESSRSSTTINEYRHYQNRILQGQEESTQSEYSDSPSSDCAGSKSKSLKRSHKMIRFGTNVDLSDHRKWATQLDELKKLPKFLNVACPEADFLPHIGHTILGMNSVQLYMKVPGARTPGHQENNNFCSININIGPGDCEWFAVHNQYWGEFHKLCEKHKLCFLTGSWWPILNELYDLKIPVYRFTQYKGDVVWLNPGTVHWVQANSVCNNIAWNIGPLTAHQFRMSWERYQWNKIQKVRSIVPMVHMAWSLVRSVKIANETLYQQLRSLLESSLIQSRLLLAHLDKAGIQVHWHGRETGEPAPCCTNCLDEVFNILFVLNHRGEYLVYCHKCATAMKKSFTVLQQYKMKELSDVLAAFKLFPSSALPISNSTR